MPVPAPLNGQGISDAGKGHVHAFEGYDGSVLGFWFSSLELFTYV